MRSSPPVRRSRRIVAAIACFAALQVVRDAQADAEKDAAPDPGGHARAAVRLGPDDAPRASSARGIEITASSEVASYGDTDNVFVFTPSIAGSIAKASEGWRISGRYLVDVVSAASADVVSTASPPFLEARQAGSIDGAYKPKSFGVGASAAVSVEPDYTSVVGGATVTQDLFAKSLTLLFGYSHLHDIAGRSGTPFSVFSRTLDRDAFKASAAIVVDRATTVSFVGDVLIEYGDPSKPYRYVPMFAPGTIVARGASVDDVTRLRLSARVLEQLPLARDRYALTMRWAHRLHASTVRLDERAYVDTWGLKATTTDARWIFDLSRRIELAPHARFYGQTPVDFWKRAYYTNPSSFTYPALRTGNRELGPLVDVTLGASLRGAIGSSDDPHAWTLGLDFDVTSTSYLDDLYLTSRISALGALSLEVSL